MALTARAFSGATFFTDVRAEMDKGYAMFGGLDGGLRYVCMDAAFYRLGVLRRSSTQSFTDAAAALPAAARVVANGQLFGTSKLDYCFRGPCSVKWQGEIIQGHVVSAGDPASRPDHRHVGQFDGRAQAAFAIAKGDPSSVTSPGTYRNALGTLLPLVSARIPFGAVEIRDPAGNITQFASPGGIGSWVSRPAGTGKIVYGVHRGSNVVFVLAQQNGAAGGLDITALIARLVSMGVDDAAMGDGSDSSTLVVDHTIEVMPGERKNDSIPCGPTFTLQTLRPTAAGILRNSATTTHPMFQKTFSLSGVTARLEASILGGVELHIDALGTSTQLLAAELAALEAILPITLNGTSSKVTVKQPFVSPQGSQAADIMLAPTATSDGRLTGTLLLDYAAGLVLFEVDWPMAPGP
jgi:hypothetical protein